MNTLTILRNTLHKLTKKEVNSLLIFLKSYRKNTDEQSLKSIQLVHLLLHDYKNTSTEIQNLLYGKSNYHAFNKLILRLKEKIYEVLSFDSNLNIPDLYGERNKTIFEIKKRLLQSEIIF